MATLLESCREHMRLTAKKELINEGDWNIQLMADLEKTERVLIKLIQNAFKYAPGSAIRLSAGKIPAFVKVEVTDQGPVMPPEKLSHIFRRYYRSDPAGIHTGLGLGLYISAEIVKLHGGDIGVDLSRARAAPLVYLAC